MTDEEIKALDQLICDADEDAFEKFMNDMCVFAIQYSEKMQNCIADHIRELFTDKCFVYLVHRYATGKNNIEMFSKEFFTYAVKEKASIDDPELEDSKHINEEFRRFIWDFLYNSKIFKGCD